MNKSKLNFSRCRPGLGTLIRVQVDNERLIDPIYSRIAEIEAIFNFHDSKSELSRYNQNALIPLSDEFQYLMALATEMRVRTAGAFTPYVEEQKGGQVEHVGRAAVDFGGLAKGFAVDEAVEVAIKLDAGASGFVEAGGDIRYFGRSEAMMNLRLGVPPQVVTRELRLTEQMMAVATSSPGMAEAFGDTRTNLRTGLWPMGSSVTVIAENCTLADALTKAVLFGGMEKLYSYKSQAQALVFDGQGQLLEGGWS